MPVLLREQPGLRDTKPADRQRRGDGYPDEVDPPGRREGAVDHQGRDNDHRADEEDQEGCRAVADVEAVELEPATTAALREANPAVEQSARPAARAITGDGRLQRRRRGRRVAWLHPACGAPQPPQT